MPDPESNTPTDLLAYCSSEPAGELDEGCAGT
jgi:hypothetical protein